MILFGTQWPRISGWVDRTTNTLRDLRAVQIAMQDRYGTPRVRVQFEQSSAPPGTGLVVDFAQPSFLDDLGDDAARIREKALEIACAARDALPAGSDYDRYKIVFTHRMGIGVSISSTQTFVFPASELPPSETR